MSMDIYIYPAKGVYRYIYTQLLSMSMYIFGLWGMTSWKSRCHILSFRPLDEQSRTCPCLCIFWRCLSLGLGKGLLQPCRLTSFGMCCEMTWHAWSINMPFIRDACDGDTLISLLSIGSICSCVSTLLKFHCAQKSGAWSLYVHGVTPIIGILMITQLYFA